MSVDALEVKRVLNREAKILEIMRTANVPLTAAEISVRGEVPMSTTYRSLAALEDIGVLVVTKDTILNDQGKSRLTKHYSIDPIRATNFVELNPTMNGTVPAYYNQLSKKLYTLLDFMGRFEPGIQTSGAKAADAYLIVAVNLLALSFKDPKDIDAKRQQVILRQYLQQAQAVIKNVDSTIEQMLTDHRLWSDELFVLSAIDEVRASKNLINERASQAIL